MFTILNSRLFGQIRGYALAGVLALGGSTVHAQSKIDPLGPQTFEKVETAPVESVSDDQTLADLQDSAIQLLAGDLGVDPTGLSAVNSTVARFPLQGVTAFAYKILNEEDGTMHSLVVDEVGLELDAAELEANEAVAYEANFGKLHPDLAQHLAIQGQGGLIPVIVWMHEPVTPAIERPEPSVPLGKEAQEALVLEVETARQETAAAAVGSVVAHLGNAGFEAVADTFAPAVYTAVDPITIDELSKLPDVQRIYLDVQNEGSLNVARSTIKADLVHSLVTTLGQYVRGYGVRVGEIEVGGRIATANPYLAGVIQDLTFSCLDPHATAVAGMIRSTHSTHRGIAPNCTLWVGGSCGGWSSELQNRASAAAAWGARAINNSWGYGPNCGGASPSLVPNADAAFFDNLVLNQWRTVVFAAGNRGNCDARVINPALAYNVISVGASDDRGTTGTADDTMASYSSFVDPTSTHGDREKPEVTAPGTNITSTTNLFPWVANTGSGTSYASPMVTGTAALLIQRNSSLSIWPEGIKAILMATAMQNLEGPLFGQSDKDGAGGIQADLADRVARGINGNWGAINYSCSSPASLNVMSMSLVAGKRTRVVIAFDSDPAYGSYTSRPCADLDMQVISPTGAFVAGSASWDNTNELVDFTPAVSGIYTLRVTKFRCDLSPRYLGFAFYRVP